MTGKLASPAPIGTLPVVGVHGYAALSVAAGERVPLRISSDYDYTVSVVRLGAPDDRRTDVAVPGLKLAGSKRRQLIRPGSYVHFDGDALPPQLGALTIELWVRPWRVGRDWQGLLSMHDWPNRCCFGIFLSDFGRVVLFLGMKQFHGPSIAKGAWVHLAAVWEGAGKAGDNVTIYVDGKPAATGRHEGPVTTATDAPLRLGAYGDAGMSKHFFDGDVAMPVLYQRALSPSEVSDRAKQKLLGPGYVQPPAIDESVLGCWPLDEETGDTIRDLSLYSRKGRIFNHATWMIGGPSFNARAIPKNYDPATDTARGHGLRLASDDLVDCGWEETGSFQLPADLESGVYSARVRYLNPQNVPLDYDIVFIVRPPPGRPKKKLLVLCSVNSWVAYSGNPFGDIPDHLQPCYPTHSFYLIHERGGEQPTYYHGLNMPLPSAQPHCVLYGTSKDYSHLLRAERFTHYWLEQNHYPFDVAADLDLDRVPGVLDGYEAVMILGHSEYWTARGWQAISDFLAAGKKVIVLSGNTMYWRVALDGDVMECRKDEGVAGGLRNAAPGECWHSGDRKRGGLMRFAGYPAWKLIGQESVGYWIKGDNPKPGVYTVASSHRLLEGMDLKRGDPLAMIAGHEGDLPIHLAQQRLDRVSPSISPPTNIEIIGECRATARDLVWDYNTATLVLDDTTLNGAMIYWDRSAYGGGRVFHAGSISAGWGLYLDHASTWSKLFQNVLADFGIPRAD